MITQEMKDKGVSCKGRGLNFYDCKDKLKCVEYEECPPISSLNIKVKLRKEVE